MATKLLDTTNPTLLLAANPLRKKLTIQMQATDVDANNTGTISIGYDFQPASGVTTPLGGDVLLQASSIAQPSGGDVIDKKYKRNIWALSSATNQTLTVEEEVESAPEKPTL